MPVLIRLLPLVLLAAALTGCGPGKDEFAPPCPRPGFVRGLEDITRFKPGSAGHDLTDMTIQGRMLALNGSCTMADAKQFRVDATVTMTAEFLRGPALGAGFADVPIFLAVTEGDTVLDKQVFSVRVAFPDNVDRVTLTSPQVLLALPSSRTKSPAAFGIIAGFQLTPEERAANRATAGH